MIGQALEIALDSTKMPEELIVRVSGRLNIHNLFEFQRIVREEHPKLLVLELSNLELLDSAGLGAIVGAYTSRMNLDESFAIVGLSERARVLFAMTKVDSILPIYNSLEAARLMQLDARRQRNREQKK